MTRYALVRLTDDGPQYVAASYAPHGSGVTFTSMRTDAGTYVTVEKAIAVCKVLVQNGYTGLVVEPIQEIL